MVAENKLKVTVVNGRGLVCNDTKKEVTPYCLLQLGKTSHETRSAASDPNPEWNEEFLFDVSPGCEVLSFSIWHKNPLKNDVVIGYAFVDFGNCKKDEKTTINIQLMGIYSGEINLVIHPMYETTASKVERLEHKIMLLTYEMSRCTGKIEQYNRRVKELTKENKRLNKVNILLEKEKRILQEYEILSTSTTPSPRRKFNHAFDYSFEKRANGSVDMKSNLCTDEFDIISVSEREIAADLKTGNNRDVTEHDYSKVDGKNTSDIDKTRLSLLDWERHLAESTEVFEDEVDGISNNVNANKMKKDGGIGILTELRNENNSLVTRVNDLEYENNELKFLIHHMKLKNDEELNILIHQLSADGEQTLENIKNQISHINTERTENEAKIDMIISDLNSVSGETGQTITRESSIVTNTQTLTRECSAGANTRLDSEKDILGKKLDLDLFYGKLNDDNDEQLPEKTPDEPDVIREYYWDEYLPISTKTSKDGGDEVNFEDFNDGITDDIDNFINSTYLFHNENALILRSDPELYTKSDIEEENEHFKDMNIRLIKENEELDGCLQLLQIQVKNLRRIQGILMDQLVKRAPAYMKQMLENITDASQILNEDQISLYKTHFGAVLDEMINLNEGKLYSDSVEADDYDFAVSLLYHPLPT